MEDQIPGRHVGQQIIVISHLDIRFGPKTLSALRQNADKRFDAILAYIGKIFGKLDEFANVGRFQTCANFKKTSNLNVYEIKQTWRIVDGRRNHRMFFGLRGNGLPIACHRCGGD